MVSAADVERVFRQEYGRVVAVLVRGFCDIDVAEDAVQDAFAVALERWPVSGLPPSPAGWLITTARNRGIDRKRRDSIQPDKYLQAALLAGQDPRSAVAATAGAEDADAEGPVRDERLRLIFTCCHPALAPAA